jgi:hypothetical protein
VIDYLRLARGFDRKAHFAAGGTPADWQGIHDIRVDKQKESNKYQCRNHDDVDDEDNYKDAEE